MAPSFSDCFFAAVLVWLFLAGASGWKALLMDGDTGWHIRTGEFILDHAQIPRQDLFSFTKPGAPWFTWEWLSDVLFALLFRAAGLKGVVLFSGVLIALLGTLILRFALWRGANVVVALPLTLLAVGASTIHFLARPHLFTLVLLPLALWMLESDRRRPTARIWLLPPLTILWTNLHGGFALFLVCLALFNIGLVIESALGNPSHPPIRRYVALCCGCLAATLVNPFGLDLHRHVLQYLRADWIRDMVQEFQAPSFRSEGQFQFEILLIAGVMAAAWLLARRMVVETLWTLFLAHSALTSVRHAPLYACVVAPIIAAVITSIWLQRDDRPRAASITAIFRQMGEELAPAFRRSTAWGPALVAVLAFLNAPVAWPSDFPSEAFPVNMVRRHSAELLTGRLLTTDQWADYLIFRNYPRQRVFVDGRSDFYGERLGREYLSLLQGSKNYLKVFDRYGFDIVLAPPDWPLSSALRGESIWRMVEENSQAILFVRSQKEARSEPNGIARRSRTLEQEEK